VIKKFFKNWSYGKGISSKNLGQFFYVFSGFFSHDIFRMGLGEVGNDGFRGSVPVRLGTDGKVVSII
jgi:hypothetical protein